MSRLARSALLLAVGFGLGFTDLGLEDPTRPALVSHSPGPAAPGDPALRLRSVVVSEWDRVAEINDRRVRVGEQVAGHLILDIDVSGVLLEGPDGETLLTLSGMHYKQPSLDDRSSQ